MAEPARVADERGEGSPELRLESRIVSVEVHARGAVVTRRVELDRGLPAGAVELVIGGITPLADPGSVRVAVDGGREVVAARSRLLVPEAPAGPGEALERIRVLDEERERLAAEQRHLAWRRGVVTKAQLSPVLEPERHADPAERMRDAVAIARLFDEVTAAMEERLGALDDLLERNGRALEAAHVAAAQAKTSERAGRGHPTREVSIRLAPGDAAMRALELSYVVGAARWWPVYAARLSEGATRVELALGALVAQSSGEDWTDVALSLSTADLVRDARLPELPSLRLGRAQPRARRGYRPAPAGLDEMFSAYDAAAAAAPPSPAQPAAPVTRAAAPPRPKKKAKPRQEEAARAAEPDLDGDDLDRVMLQEDVPPPSFAPPPPPRAVPGPVAGAPAPQAIAHPKSRSMWLGGVPGGGGAPPAEEEEITASMSVPAPSAIEPADAWLDFDVLALASPEDRRRRGRLAREQGAAAPDGASAAARIDAIPAPLHGHDPRTSRGQFDHRYQATARADVPSDSRPHRVLVAQRSGAARPRFVTVPREAAEIYREVELTNPLDAPLLAGPVDVFLDGALVTTSAIGAVDRGGVIKVGLGLEDRLRIARNARVEEGSAGLLGGSTSVEHTVSIELRSSLGRTVTVEVLDRVPVTDDPDVEITRASRPEAEEYDQSERGAPIRGGVRWLVELPGGGTARVELRYRIKLPAKNEIVGGNRRE